MNMKTNNSPDFLSYIGNTQQQSDQIDVRTVYSLAATFDDDPKTRFPDNELPQLWHWAFFTPTVLTSKLAEDGHPLNGNFLPLFDLPNRMWAGGRVNFHQPLHLGEKIERSSTILRCERKKGRSGELVFVTIQHEIFGEDGLALEEEQHIVYRNSLSKKAYPAGELITSRADYRQQYQPNPILLFRYSALTFNSHRIHYDQPYATENEGYPGLIVHGPLTATLLLNTFSEQNPGARIGSFSFRALSPMFVTQKFDLCGRIIKPGSSELWTECAGRQTVKATVDFD